MGLADGQECVNAMSTCARALTPLHGGRGGLRTVTSRFPPRQGPEAGHRAEKGSQKRTRLCSRSVGSAPRWWLSRNLSWGAPAVPRMKTYVVMDAHSIP